jgi:hypothetical protein
MNVLSRMNYRERQAYRESRKAEIAEQKARKQAAAMTCQCCGRQIFAQRGKIAHHGYERPGYGWQTASCMGALYLPFEVARERLADLIVSLKGMIDDSTNHLIAISAEKVKLPFSIEVDCDEYYDRNGRKRSRKDEVRAYSRSEFDALKELGHSKIPAHHAACDDARINKTTYPKRDEALQIYFSHDTWDGMKQRAYRETEYRLQALRADLEMSETRFAGWQQTHTGFDKKTKEWRVKG